MEKESEVSSPAERKRKLSGCSGIVFAFVAWYILGTGYIFSGLSLDFPDSVAFIYGGLTILTLILLLASKQVSLAYGLILAVLVNFALAILLGFKMDSTLAILRYSSVPISAFYVVYLLLGGTL